ncbi:MAG TPA: 3-phosphoshikimate 1-carboxyvinyltransferase [Conexibacter sp.]|nr:3-phosphoshikimate 1-carboxyvinyltransferase [Conexibacter sp.]
MRFDRAARGLSGSLRVPADKSISHRAALLGAMSSGPVRVTNYLDAADTNSTLAAVQALGARVERGAAPGELTIHGVGLHGPQELDGPIDVGNAGTLMRLMPGWLAGRAGRSWTFDGDDSIRRRPIDRIAEPLRRMGARIDARDGRFAPFTIAGAQLDGIAYELPVASAQVKSCVLIAGMATVETRIVEPLRSRDHTERMLALAGAPFRYQGDHMRIGYADELRIDAVDVPGDLSSAAFFVAAALLVPASRVLLEGVNVNWTRTGFLRIAKRMGARIEGDLEREEQFQPREPVSDLDVATGLLTGTTVEPEEVPLAIDELPLVALLGCFAEGETVVRGAGELRVKESDRIATVVEGLRALGGDIEATEDGFVVRGTGGLRGGRISSHGDHRLAMLGAIAGLASREGVEVDGMDAAAVSYPGFVGDLRTLLAR